MGPCDVLEGALSNTSHYNLQIPSEKKQAAAHLPAANEEPLSTPQLPPSPIRASPSPVFPHLPVVHHYFPLLCWSQIVILCYS